MLNVLATLMFQDTAQPSPEMNAMATVFMVLWVVVVIIEIAAMWKVFTKAGEPGWAAIIPIYNFLILLKIAGRPMWWIILMLIPIVNIVIVIIVMIDLAKNFGKGAGFGVGLALFGPIFFPILAWGDARYSPRPVAA